MQDMSAEELVRQELIEYREAWETDREAIVHCLKGLQGFERQHEEDLLPPDEVALQHFQYHEAQIAKRGGKFFVALVRDQVVGCICVWRGERLDTHLSNQSEIAFVPTFFVDAAYRRMGIGTQLMKFAEEWASLHGLWGLKISHIAKNTTARNFYAEIGYDEYIVERFKRLS
jgi:diamine N-acetyltransferase